MPNYDPTRRERKQSGRQSQNVIYVLTEFALELMRVLDAFNAENFQSDGKLRIGEYFSHFGIFAAFKPIKPPAHIHTHIHLYTYTKNAIDA